MIKRLDRAVLTEVVVITLISVLGLTFLFSAISLYRIVNSFAVTPHISTLASIAPSLWISLMPLTVPISALFAAALVFGLAGILTFGALTPLGIIVLAVLPVGYHTIFLGRQGATPGMRLFDLELRAWTGRPPDYAQAFLTTVLFYASVSLTAWLILLVAPFTERRRTLHDLLAGTVMVRHARLNATAGPG